MNLDGSVAILTQSNRTADAPVRVSDYTTENYKLTRVMTPGIKTPCILSDIIVLLGITKYHTILAMPCPKRYYEKYIVYLIYYDD